MLTISRLQHERDFHDAQATERAESYRVGRAELRFDDSAYLDHETWVRPAWQLLGELQNKRFLDYGCGHGMAATVAARAGATVAAFDLSSGYVEEAIARAMANGCPIRGVIADAHQLPFAENSFDVIWGSAILHHLDLQTVGRELARVLAPGGVAVFCEPWGGNPLLEFARKYLPYRGKARTPDEVPLKKRDLKPLSQVFGKVELHGVQFLRMIARAVGGPRIAMALDAADTRLLRLCPQLQNCCRYAVIVVRKPIDDSQPRHQTKISFTTLPCTSVSRKSRPL